MKSTKGKNQADVMLRSIQQIGKDMAEGQNVKKTQDITEKLKENKRKFSDLLSASYDGAFDISK